MMRKVYKNLKNALQIPDSPPDKSTETERFSAFSFPFGVFGFEKFWVMFLTAILTALVNLRIYIEILKIITQRKDEYDIINARN